MIDITEELKKLIALEDEIALWYISYFMRRHLPNYVKIPRQDLEHVIAEYEYQCKALGREPQISMQEVYSKDHPIIARVMKRLLAVPK